MWQELRRAINDRMRQSAYAPQIAGAAVISRFRDQLKKHLPPELLGSARAKKFNHGILTVEVEHPAVMQRLQQNESAICANLRSQGYRVERIVFLIRPRKSEA
jgi:hypothetical protein